MPAFNQNLSLKTIYHVKFNVEFGSTSSNALRVSACELLWPGRSGKLVLLSRTKHIFTTWYAHIRHSPTSSGVGYYTMSVVEVNRSCIPPTVVEFKSNTSFCSR